MKKLFVLGIALFFCLFFVGCSWVTTPPIIPDNGGMDEYDSQFISLLDKLNTPLKLLNFLSTCHYTLHDGTYTPYEFYIKKEGDCVDFGIFNCYVLHYYDYNVYSVPIFFLNDYEFAGHLLTVFEYKDTDADWYWGSTLDKYGVIDVSSLFGSVSPALNSIEACVNSYIDFLGDSYTLASYKVNPWNYCGYRTIDRQ
jgi:hypothetical protein